MVQPKVKKVIDFMFLSLVSHSKLPSYTAAEGDSEHSTGTRFADNLLGGSSTDDTHMKNLLHLNQSYAKFYVL